MSDLSINDTTHFLDTPQRYGLISRVFHWGMALLLLWMLLSAVTRFFFEDTAIESFFWAGHFLVGLSILVLAVARGTWGLINLRHRPAYASGWLGGAAAAGHLCLYGLMIVTPSLALLRAYGSQYGLVIFGIETFPQRDPEIDWMVDLGGLLHGELGWALFAIIAGHIVMAFLHERLAATEVLSRMGARRRLVRPIRPPKPD